MQNAPQKVFELIGDPRSGLSDSVTSNSFGEITADLLHHQQSNEVYWYKYEFAGNALRETHRDARLSEHAKNLMYILRAKDPNKWTVAALAKKFHVRRQRVLAILALKEMEAHRLEAGTSLTGALSAYACPVHLSAVHLDPKSGEPLEGKAAKGAAQKTDHRLEGQLPRLRRAAQQSQVALLEVLRPLGYRLEALKADIDQQVAKLEGLFLKEKESEAEEKEGDGSSSNVVPNVKSPEQQAAEALLKAKEQLSQLLDLLGQALGASEAMREEAAVASTTEALKEALGRRPPAQASDSEAAQEEAEALGKLTEGWEGQRLLRLVLSLQPTERDRLVGSVQRVAIDLNGQAVDFEALLSSTSDNRTETGSSVKKPPPASAISPPLMSPLPADVFGFRPVPEETLTGIVRGVGKLEDQLRILDELSRSDKTPPRATSLGSEELLRLLQLRRTYLSADAMLSELQVQVKAEDNGSSEPRRVTEEEKRRMIKVLHAADPAYPERALKYEALMQALEHRDMDVALQGLQELEGSEDGARAVLSAMSRRPAAPNEVMDPERLLKKGEDVAPRDGEKMHRESWDLVSAFLDAKVARKVYNRGSGERHLVRLPSYPKFEGYTLQQFDEAHEGELSQLNREVAKREEEELVSRFSSSLAYNLGLVGPDLWDTSRPKPQPNLASALDRPIVVYDIDGASGETMYPPLKVVEADGKERPLNDQEKVFQERRRPLRPLPYLLQRIRRKPEIL